MLSNTANCTLSGTPEQLVTMLDQVYMDDKSAERRKRSSCTAALLFLLATVGLTMVHFSSTAWGWIWLACLLGVPTSLAAYAYFSAHDLDDAKVETARRLVEVLRVDLPPEAALELRLDFRPHHKFVKKRDGGFFSSLNVYRFEQSWLQLKGALADGTRVELEVTRSGVRKEKKKRKRVKVTERRADTITVGLRVDPERYPDLTGLSQVLAPPPREMVVRGCRVEGRRATLTARTPVGQIASAEYLLAALAWSYRSLHGLRRAAPATGL